MIPALQDWKVDPDHKQDRGNGTIKTRKMTRKDWKKYGPVNTELKRTGNFKIKPDEANRAVRNRKKAKV